MLDVISALGEWFLSNLDRLVFSTVTLVVVYIVYRIIIREIQNLEAKKKLQEHLAYNLIRIAKWASAAIIISAVLAKWE